ncbi:unnamed protein product [Mytilus coruscus]|uniref:Uncharacterized protein n=1 Tax=Mytilus coruscus TaxID=42192 RepID=A0A6J8C0Y5_MYTCO|nr:unnamed protein product [Mytilus coruscus]
MARTTKDSSSKKKKSVSKTAELENKLTSCEDRFGMLFAFFNILCAGSSSSTEVSQFCGLDTQREQSSDKVPSTGEHRPGNPRIRNVDSDNRSEISLHQDSRENGNLLGLCSSEDEDCRSISSPAYSQAELEDNSQKKSKIDAEHYTPFLKQAKIENKVASLVRDKLYIDGALYKPNNQSREFREEASLITVSGGVPLPILQIDRQLQTDKFNQLQVHQFHLGHLRGQESIPIKKPSTIICRTD